MSEWILCRARRWQIAAILLAMLLGVVQPAAAHGYLVRAIPDDRAVLDRAPTRVEYWFSETLEPSFSTITVRDQTGKVIATGGVDANDSSLMAAKLPSGLPDGVYVVDLRPAFSDDGHVVVESRVFFVGKEAGSIDSVAASQQALPTEVVWRILVMSSTMLLFGVFALYTLVLVPAWGSKEHPAGFLPPRVMRRLNGIVWTALALALIGHIVALLQQTTVFFNVDATAAISQGLWNITRIGSRFGDLWSARMVALALVAMLHASGQYLRREYPETVSAFWSANAWLMALVVGTLSAGSHAAGSLIQPWLGIAMDWLHATGVALWAGGVMALVLVLPLALQPYQGETRRLALLAVMQRFSRMATACVVVVVTTGIYSALNWLYTPADLTQTLYGDTLLLKGLLVALLLGVAALHHLALHPDLAAQSEQRTAFLGALRQRVVPLFYRLTGLAGAFAATLRLEAVLVGAVFVAVGFLSATPPPAPDFSQVSPPPARQTQTVDGWTIAATLTPGSIGINTLDTLITRDGQPVDGLDVRLQLANPARDRRTTWQTTENADKGLYVTGASDFDSLGIWWTLVDIRSLDGATSRAAFAWTINDSLTALTARPLGVANVLALLLVLAGIGWVVFPTAQRYYRKLDLRPATLTAVFGVTGITILLIGVGFYVVQDSQRRVAQIQNPPPKIVNTVLPDAASLQRGAALYAAHCQQWETAGDDFAILRDGVDNTRDEVLYDATLNGWRSLPPCTSDLTAAQRWDIVNYFRTVKK